MSVVTGVMLICELSGYDDRPDTQVQQIMDWLAERSDPPARWALKEVADYGGGSKHPQFDAWCGGFNHFDHLADEFAAFVMSRDWYSPENLVLIMQPEEGCTKVFRPRECATTTDASKVEQVKR